jgi:hypothetical protein
MRHRLPNRFRKDYTGEYRRKRYERQKEEIAEEERQDAALAVYQTPRFFEINGLLSKGSNTDSLATAKVQNVLWIVS